MRAGQEAARAPRPLAEGEAAGTAAAAVARATSVAGAVAVAAGAAAARAVVARAERACEHNRLIPEPATAVARFERGERMGLSLLCNLGESRSEREAGTQFDPSCAFFCCGKQ